MSQCPTTSGPYRCKHDAGHTTACETEEVPRTPPLGPYRDAWRGRAYLRGRLDAASGAELGAIGALLCVHRRAAEDDAVYRERIWRVS